MTSTIRGDAQPEAAGPSRQSEARRLASARRWLFLCGALANLGLPYLLWASGLARAWWQRTVSLPLNYWLAVPLFALLVLGALAICNLPFAWYGGFRLAHRYDLSRQTPLAWLLDWLKATLLGLVLGGLAAPLLYSLLALSPTAWWWLFALVASLAMIGLTFVAPYILVPIFYRMRPLEDMDVVETIRRLSIEANAEVREVSTLDFSRKTVEANAAVIGLGRSRRVVLADTLLSQFSLPEVRSVVAHELGHHVHRDVVRLLMMQSAMIWIALALVGLFGEAMLGRLGATGGLGEPATLPLLLVATELFGLCTLPVSNALSRRLEATADGFALDLTDDPSAFSSAMRKLAEQNLAEREPPRWAELLLHSHPSIGRRIRFAESRQREPAGRV